MCVYTYIYIYIYIYIQGVPKKIVHKEINGFRKKVILLKVFYWDI